MGGTGSRDKDASSASPSVLSDQCVPARNIGHDPGLPTSIEIIHKEKPSRSWKRVQFAAVTTDKTRDKIQQDRETAKERCVCPSNSVSPKQNDSNPQREHNRLPAKRDAPSMGAGDKLALLADVSVAIVEHDARSKLYDNFLRSFSQQDQETISTRGSMPSASTNGCALISGEDKGKQESRDNHVKRLPRPPLLINVALKKKKVKFNPTTESAVADRYESARAALRYSFMQASLSQGNLEGASEVVSVSTASSADTTTKRAKGVSRCNNLRESFGDYQN